MYFRILRRLAEHLVDGLGDGPQARLRRGVFAPVFQQIRIAEDAGLRQRVRVASELHRVLHVRERRLEPFDHLLHPPLTLGVAELLGRVVQLAQRLERANGFLLGLGDVVNLEIAIEQGVEPAVGQFVHQPTVGQVLRVGSRCGAGGRLLHGKQRSGAAK